MGLVVLGIGVFFAGSRWLAARLARPRSVAGVDRWPDPDCEEVEVEIPDTVPIEWVDAYRTD
jgi:hypothetical protein